MKTLYLLRHAKSDWESEFSLDHERGLAPRGEKAAKQISRYWDEIGFHVDTCYCSDAVRCLKTWEILETHYSSTDHFEERSEIYQADLDSLLDLVRYAPETSQSLLLIGHNPGLEELAEYLILGERREELHNPLFTKFPTTAFLGISLSVESWRDISPGHASIILYWIPGKKGRS
jgi:phosphohistidine phosphatase